MTAPRWARRVSPHTGGRSPRARGARGPKRPRDTPLRIVYEMESPVIYSGQPIHFDALLAHVVQRGGGPTRHDAEPPPDHWVPLPLVYREHHGVRWYRASAWWPEPETPSSRQRWAQKWDRDHEHWLDTGKAKTVTLTNGPLKESFVPMQACPVESIEFWAVGDLPHVTQLAKRVVAIGKKTSQGYGRVRRCSVRRIRGENEDPRKLSTRLDPETWDLDWRRSDGTPARNLPASWWAEMTGRTTWVDRAPVSPPYWRRSSRATVGIAGLSR